MSIPSYLNILPFAEINEKHDIFFKKSLSTATVITKAKEQNQIFGQSSKAMSQYVFG